MSAPDLSTSVLDSFRGTNADKHATILLGAGASTSSGLPDWNTFAEQLLLSSGAISKQEVAQLLVQREDPLLVAEAAHTAVADDRQWYRVMRQALYSDIEALSPSPLHLAAAGYLLGDQDQHSRLATLNFDTLIEQAINDTEGKSVSHSITSDWDADHRCDVCHLHGFMTETEIKSVVLTLNDVTALVGKSEAWQRNYLRSARAEGAIIIAGTSYRDPDLRQWLYEIEHNDDFSARNHRVFVLLAREGFGMTQQEFDDARRAIEDEWKGIGIQPILLQDFADAAQIIRELRSLHLINYLSPQERAKAIWQYHADRFADLQERYAAKLSNDAEILADALGEDTMNLTLWLADGNKHLARWASQDRQFLNPHALRLIASGHDSPMVAGQAFGTETSIFQDLNWGDASHWKSVLATPIVVSYQGLPPFADAVLSVGLPQGMEEYQSSALLWNKALLQVAASWETLLSEEIK